jgi:hypothetical protein
LILPPRLEGREAEQAAAMIEIPIYEADHFDSLRPTWLPVDPSTYRPPPKRLRAAKIASIGKIATLLLVTFGLAFASVVAPQVAREHAARRAAAASNASSAIDETPENHGRSASSSTVVPSKSADAVTLTVDVMNLPVSKDFPLHKKARVASHAAGS